MKKTQRACSWLGRWRLWRLLFGLKFWRPTSYYQSWFSLWKLNHFETGVHAQVWWNGKNARGQNRTLRERFTTGIIIIAACTENSWFQAYVCHCGDWRGSKRLLKLSSRVSFQSPWRTSLCVCWGGLSLCFEINFTCEFRVEKTLKNQQLLLCLAQDDRVHVKPPP